MKITKDGILSIGMLTIAIGVSLPGFCKSLSIFILGLIVLYGLVSKSDNMLRDSKIETILVFPVLLYIVYCIGMIYTSNLARGRLDLEIKLPLLLLPIFMVLIPKELISPAKLKTYWKTMIITLAATLVYLLIRAIINHSPELGFFYSITYIRLSGFHHPTYLSLIVLTAMIYSYIHFKKPYGLILYFFFNIFLLLLSSRTGFIGLVMVYIWTLYRARRVEKKPKKALYLLGSFLVILVLNTLSFSLESRLYDTMDETKNAIGLNKEENGVDTKRYTRKYLYIYSYRYAKKNPLFGVGTGDVRDELESYYNEEGIEFEIYLNPHNQYLQTSVALGLFGLIFLIAMIIYPMIRSIKQKQYHILVLLLIMSLSLMFESMLERQMGTHSFLVIYIYLALELYHSQRLKP